jgi:hypothetical protein
MKRGLVSARLGGPLTAYLLFLILEYWRSRLL